MLIEWGASVNLPTAKDGLTALHIGVLKKHPNVVRFVLEAGCDKDQKDEDGFTALHKAFATPYEPHCLMRILRRLV